jgi:glycosyltransferase involved in cell wall biosynthesis
MKVSIVIPTLNEENLLPVLLDSIKMQSYSDCEIIVADAGSTDTTRNIAVSRGAKVVEGGLPGPGRNAGAAHAKGEYIFFLDADVQLPGAFLENAVGELDERYLDLATCEIRPTSGHVLDRVVHKFINMTVKANLRIDPKAMGFCIFVTRRLFNRVKGFDETIRVGEDAEFVKRAAKLSNLRWLSSVYINVSVRRFEKEGRLAYIKKGIKLNLYRMFRGEVRTEAIEYEFAHYDEKEHEYKVRLVQKIEQALMKLEKKDIRDFYKPEMEIENTLDEAAEDLKRLFEGSKERD